MRRESIFEDVMKMPWPVGVVLAAIVFFGFHAYQLVAPQTQLGQAVLPAIRMVAYIFSVLFLFAAFLSFLTQKIRSKRFKSTKTNADLRGLTWRQFESLIGEVFREKGYFVMETPEGPDNGVDLVLRKDGEKTYVQCKHWKSNNVGVNKVRELLGSMTAGGAVNGVLVTSGYYTRSAQESALQSGIELIDGDAIASMIGERVNEQPILETHPGVSNGIACPNCSAPMVERVASRGRYKGSKFLGCTRFPECRGVRNI